MKLYQYPACSTCRKASSFLKSLSVEVESIHIVTSPPSEAELLAVAKQVPGGAKKLFNTSGEVYRELELKDLLPSMSEEEMVRLLSQHGKLIKRPLLVGDNVALVGFNEAEWRAALS